MHWFILIIAGIFEVGFATCLGKFRDTTGNTSLLWFSGFLICLTTSIYLLYRATETLPLGTAYAIWTGIGAVGIVLVGIAYFKEPIDFWRVLFLTTLIASIVGLKLVTK